MKRSVILAVLVCAAVSAACSSGGSSAPPTPYIAPTPAGGLTAAPQSVHFDSVPSVQTIVVSEPGYGGAFTAKLTCTPVAGGGAVASVAPSAATPAIAGQPVSFSLSAGLVAGSCSLSIADTAGNSGTIAVASDIPGISPLTISTDHVDLRAPARDVTFSVQEAGYGGIMTQYFSAVTTCMPAGIATVTTSAFPSIAGGPATFYVGATEAGSCVVAVSDGVGQSARLTLTISAP